MQPFCPLCNKGRIRVHSYYTRRIMDLPMIGNQTWLVLKARKFYYINACCKRKVFTERFTVADLTPLLFYWFMVSIGNAGDVGSLSWDLLLVYLPPCSNRYKLLTLIRQQVRWNKQFIVDLMLNGTPSRYIHQSPFWFHLGSGRFPNCQAFPF
jgi:hypothetical protein